MCINDGVGVKGRHLGKDDGGSVVVLLKAGPAGGCVKMGFVASKLYGNGGGR